MDKTLFSGKTVMYVHGFGSSAQSGTVTRIREALPQANVIAFDLPIHPEEAIALLKEKCAEHQPHLIIGTSMGGMYTEMLYGYDRIVVNPAFKIADTMREHGLTGKQEFFSKRQDGVQEFYVDKALVKEYAQVSERCFSGVTEEEQERVIGLFGDEDDLVDTFDLFHSHYPDAIRFHGGHRMTDQSFLHSVLPVIKWVDDRQERREHPVVYVSSDALWDSFGKPLSCMQKAWQMLTEQYNAYIVAQAPRYDDRHYGDLLTWTEQYLGVTTYNHVIFSHDTQLLLGDFLIARKPSEDFMGTQIALGSDDFKTWEEIITYFSRLQITK